ncbi:MAG TPA: altronate hydrolase [Bacteroidales bacterium]|nr:altronate hydrolase [Bacteroidales bacterium]HBQ84652.1 altronate hydrolase [Bacteroidales bacterium]HCU20038.1 altronate hydrolase [Bacteroidales bacterium]
MAFGITGVAFNNKGKHIRSADNLVEDPLRRDPESVKNRIIHLHPQDNVAVALEDLDEGTKVSIDNLPLVLDDFIAAKHKFTLSDIPVGETIYLYGIKVGIAVKAIKKGTAITTENTVNAISEVQRNTTGNFKWTPPGTDAFKNRSFMGYHRPDGQVGTANYWLVIPMVFCENRNIEIIKEAVLSELGYQQSSPYIQFTRELISQHQEGGSPKETSKIAQTKIHANNYKTNLFKNVTGIKFLTHSGGCGETRQDSEELCGLLAGYITHPNVAGATILSLGCQNAQLSILQKEIKKRDANFSKPYFEFEQQEIGTEDEMIRQAIRSIVNGLIMADQIERKPAPLSKLTIGVECGGSDGFSGISANPAVGHVSDLIVALGGSVILSEFPELSGVEQNIYDRCTKQVHADKFLDLMQMYNARAVSVGSGFDMNPSPGNIKDGLITDAMKSAGAAKKGGTSPVTGVFDYPEKADGPGLHLLCTPGNDVESVTAEVASGANLVLFTTGLGTPTGNPVVPVIKISTNTSLSEKMSDIIDINAGTIIDGEESIGQTAERILNYAIEVASGIKEPAGIRNEQVDFIPWRRGVSL